MRRQLRKLFLTGCCLVLMKKTKKGLDNLSFVIVLRLNHFSHFNPSCLYYLIIILQLYNQSYYSPSIYNLVDFKESFIYWIEYYILRIIFKKI